jgi:hypothetical protein
MIFAKGARSRMIFAKGARSRTDKAADYSRLISGAFRTDVNFPESDHAPVIAEFALP